jgi:hypothetical protein
LAVSSDERVPEKGTGCENAVEDGSGIGKSGEREGERDEEGDEEVVLLKTFTDDVSVKLVEMEGSLASS